MRTRHKLSFSVLALAGALLARSATATIINFEDTSPPNGASSITSDGFVFNFAANGWGTYFGEPGCCSDIVTDGSTYLIAAGGSPASVTMTAADSHLFSIQQLDAATAFDEFATGGILMTGNLGAGGTVTETLSVTNAYQTFAIDPSFTGLSSVVFSDTVSGAFRSTPGIGLDNIVADTTVPEPSTLALLGFGAFLVSLRRRKA